MIFPAEGTLAAKGGGSLMAILCQGIREAYKMPLEMLSALQHLGINVSYIEYALYLVLL